MFHLSDGLNIRTLDLRQSVCCDLDDVLMFTERRQQSAVDKGQTILRDKKRKLHHLLFKQKYIAAMRPAQRATIKAAIQQRKSSEICTFRILF